MHDWSLRNSSRESKTSSAILIGSEIERSANSSIIFRRISQFGRYLFHEVEAVLEVTPLRVVIPFKSSFGLVTVLLGRVPEVKAVLEVTNLESMLGNLPSIHLEFEELELDRQELDKQEVEQPEVDRFDLDEPGVGKLEID
ncbi:hypothetical protein Tco_0674648 [Tanacetum coccineum]